MTVLRAPQVRMRLWWTALLVLIALGGAGLAVAADRPHTALQRPELTWRADQAAQPWIQALAAELADVDRGLVGLSANGRQALSQLQALDLERMRSAQAEGDEISAGLEVPVRELASLHAAALAAVDTSRLGPQARGAMEQLSSAVLSAENVPAHWRSLAADTGRVAGLVDGLLRHDDLVLRATTAGRQSQWHDALAFISQATGPLDEAGDIRDELSSQPGANVATLDDLLARYAAYDDELTTLYTYIRDTGQQEGERFDLLQQRVERAQEALPTDTTFMSVIVSEAAGPSLTEALVGIEAAHGDILEALSAVAGPDPAAP